jgi:hypothetical protein
MNEEKDEKIWFKNLESKEENLEVNGKIDETIKNKDEIKFTNGYEPAFTDEIQNQVAKTMFNSAINRFKDNANRASYFTFEFLRPYFDLDEKEILRK